MTSNKKPATRPTVNVVIDGNPLTVPEGTLVVEAAKLLGTSIPVYCYHPKMDPAGLCRICLVEIEKMPKLQIACATRVSEGMVVHTTSARVAEARRGVLEFLLLNHPLDCPICDKGGECDLQDFSMSYGAGKSRLTDPKLHKPKRVDLGPTIVLDEERCILCRRCTRFDDEIAQERNLIVAERGHRSLISTRDAEGYRSYFSGNTTEICPVGALTSKAYRFRSRPWDLGHTDSVCTQCSVGCNYRIDTRFGRVMRTFTRENPEIDDGWICDRGRYTFNYLYSPQRLRQPLLRRDADLEPASFDEAIAFAAERIGRARGRVGVIGGGRLSDEEAYALQKFARRVLGTNNVDYRTHIQRFASPARFSARITDIDDADLVLMFGAHTPEQAPILDLRLRRAVARRHTKLMHIGPYRPDYAVPVQHVDYPPGAIAELMQQLADTVHHGREETGDGFVADIAQQLVEAEKIIAIHNGRNVAGAAELERLMETLARYDHQVGILVVGAQGNARGAEAAGCVPNLGPGYAPAEGDEGMATNEMLAAAADGKLDALLVFGANPALTGADGTLARRAFERVPFLLVADQVLTETAAAADVVFAAASFAEKRGHATNLEGRRQAFDKAVEPPIGVASDAEIIAALAKALGKAGEIPADPDVLFVELLRAEETAAAGRGKDAPLARPRVADSASNAADQVDATHRRLTIVPIPHLYAGGGAAAHDPGLAEMRPKPFAIFHAGDAARIGLAEGERVALTGPGGTIEVEARIGPQAPAGVALVLADMPEAPESRLLDDSGFGWATAAKVPIAKEATA